MKKNNFFWVSYADLMTSMFFVMLVLFIVTIAILHKQKGETETVLENIKNVEKALQKIDTTYFEFNEISKRYRLKIDISFVPNEWEEEYIRATEEEKRKLIDAGKDLYDNIKRLISQNDSVDYLLIVEGTTMRWKNNWTEIESINKGYILSYKRALTLVNLWKKNGINFNDLGKHCELIIAGSGYFGHSRDEDERQNKRFTIQITSKIGKLIDLTDENKNE